MTNSISAQAQQGNTIGIKIISPSKGQQVPVGELTISGISTDNSTTDCTVYADWNNLKPFQTAVATGPGGVNDYSTWNFTYTPQYHIITNGTNNLTSKLSCFDDSNGGTANLTKNYSIDVIGIATTIRAAEAAAISAQGEVQKQQQFSAIDNNNSLINGISNTDNNNATTLDNETKVVVEEEEEIPTGNNNVSKPSIPMPIVAESYLNPNTVNVNITSPVAGQQVPAGNLTVTGISSDNSTTDCQVWFGWNEQKPFQTAVATGPGGVNDYSTWNFTYTPQYHIITNGTNELTAQISCFNSNTLSNITKSYSVNVTGIIESSEQSSLTAQNVSSSLPSVKIDNNDNNRTATATPPPPPPSQIIPSVPTISPLPLQPAIKDDEEKEQTEDEPEPESEDEPEPESEDEPEPESEDEPEPESEPQPTTSPTEDDKTEEDTDEEENTSEQGKEVEEIQEEEEVQEQLQQILEKVGKVEQEVQQEVGKIEEDILEEIESGLR
jgi:Asp/Glu/hydantoin racemase